MVVDTGTRSDQKRMQYKFVHTGLTITMLTLFMPTLKDCCSRGREISQRRSLGDNPSTVFAWYWENHLGTGPPFWCDASNKILQIILEPAHRLDVHIRTKTHHWQRSHLACSSHFHDTPAQHFTAFTYFYTWRKIDVLHTFKGRCKNMIQFCQTSHMVIVIVS